MEPTTMTKQQNDFLKPLLDMMNRRMDGLEAKMDTNTSLTQRALEEIQVTNGNVDGHGKKIRNLENNLAKLERKGGRKVDLSPNVMYLIALGAVILLMIVASALHINLGGLLK